MRYGKDLNIPGISSPTELFIKSIKLEPPVGNTESHGEPCIICDYKGFEYGFTIGKTFSPNYGEYPMLMSGDIICPFCHFVIRNNLRRYLGAIFWINNNDRGAFLIASPKKNKKLPYDEKTGVKVIYQKDSVLDYILNPPVGIFAMCFNKNILGSNGTHFILFARLNLNKGDCSHYYVSIYNKDILLDIAFIRDYVNIIKEGGKSKKKDAVRLINFNSLIYPKTFETFSPLGRDNIIKNMYAINFVNYFLRRS